MIQGGDSYHLLQEIFLSLVSPSTISRTPRRASTRIALHARPVPHQREVAALRAHLAFVALGLGFRPAFGLARGDGHGGAAGLAPLHGFQLFRRRQVVAGLPASARPRLRGCRRARALGPWPAIAVTLPEPRASTSTPRMTTRLSVRERVRPLDRYLLAWWPSDGSLPSSTPLPIASKFELARDRHARDRSATCS